MCSGRAIYFRHQFVEGPKIVEDSKKEKTAGEHINNTGDPFSEIETMNTEETKKDQQNPGDIVIHPPRFKSQVGLAFHGGDQKEIDNPADKQEAKREEVDSAGDWHAVIKTMGPSETKKPEDVAYDLLWVSLMSVMIPVS